MQIRNGIMTYFLISIIMTNQCISGMDLSQRNKPTSGKGTKANTQDLLDAIRSKNIDRVKQALRQPFDIDHKDKGGDNLLLIAAKTGATILSVLLADERFQQPEHINHQNQFGTTVLMHVCHKNDVLNFRTLVALKGINFKAQDRYMNSVAHHAVKSSSADDALKMISLLVDNQADFTIQNNFLITPALIIATKETKLPSEKLRKIMYQKGRYGNNQLHLLATARVDKLALKPECNPYKKMIKLAEEVGLTIWDRNDYGHLPIEIAVMEFEKLREENEKSRTDYLFDAATRQEKILHGLLIIYAERIGNHKPVRITSPYATHLNVETKIAQSYATKSSPYYDTDMDYRTEIKRKLSENPSKLPILWVSQETLNQ